MWPRLSLLSRSSDPSIFSYGSSKSSYYAKRAKNSRGRARLWSSGGKPGGKYTRHDSLHSDCVNVLREKVHITTNTYAIGAEGPQTVSEAMSERASLTANVPLRGILTANGPMIRSLSNLTTRTSCVRRIKQKSCTEGISNPSKSPFGYWPEQISSLCQRSTRYQKIG